MKRIIFFILLVIISENFKAQNTVGTTIVTNEVFEGFTLITSGTKTFLIDNCGQIINEWTSEYLPANAVYLLPNGNLLRAGRILSGSSISMGGAGGIVQIFDWEGNLEWSFLYHDQNKRQHHDVYPLPNGNILILAATVMTQQEAINAGRDPNLLPDNRLYNEQIIEVEPVGTDQANIVWEWNIKDHLIQDFNSSKENFGVVSNSPEKLDINFLNDDIGSENWLHVNSIQYDENLDQIVLSSRKLSEFYIIDHSTTTAEAAGSTGGQYGKGGDFLYRWGNSQAYQQGNADDRILYGQHFPHFISPQFDDGGKIILFNNGFGRTPEFSEVMIISPPQNPEGFYIKENGIPFGPIAPDYIYSDLTELPSPFFSNIVSGAQRLPNGNTLICEGRTGEIFEINQNNETVWYYINPHGSDDNVVNQGDSPPANNLLFRATKYPLSYPAFDDKNLSPNPPIEGNPNISDCLNTLSNQTFEVSEIKVYPIPASHVLNIISSNSFEKLSVFDIQGKKILEHQYTNRVDVSNFRSGIYFLKIYFKTRAYTTKFIVR